MNANTCATCRWWKQQQSDMLPLGEGNAWCEMAQNHYDCGGLKHPESLCRAEDGERYIAGLVTNANFGCNQHSPKI